MLALSALAAETVLSLERVAAVISLAAHTPYSKQALHKRRRAPLESFLAQLASALFGQLLEPLKNRGWLAPFCRVLLQDSTVQSLPPHLAGAFAGPANP